MDQIYFELGFIKLKDKSGKHHTLQCEEISVSIQNENTPRYAVDILGPIDIAPGKKKYNFTIKKPKFFESDLLFVYGVYTTNFDLKLYRMVNEHEMSAGARAYEQEKYNRKIDERRQDQKINNLRKNKMLTAAIKAQNPSAGAYIENAETGLDKDGGMAKVGDYFIEHVITLSHCVVDSASFGNFDGTKPVTEEIQGQAQYLVFSQNTAGYYKKTIDGDEL
jgi:hypothetical protein